MGWRGRTAAVLACLSLLSCSEAGRVRLQVLWPEQGGAPDEVYFRTQVRLGAGAGAVESDPVGPVTFGDDARIALPNIPNGNGHVIAIEVTQTPDADVVLFFGESDPFDLEAGKITDVAVPLQLRRPPQTGTGTAAITIEDGRPIVADPNVRLTLRTDTGVVAELSNRPGFTSDVEVIDLTTGEACVDATCVYRVDWDLDRGLAEPCVDDDNCLRRVFVRFRDESGFRSGAVSASVVVDTKAPTITGAAVQYVAPAGSVLERIDRATGGTEVFVTLNFSEPIDAALTIVAANGGSTLSFAPLMTLDGDVTSVEMSAIVDPARHADGPYVPMVEMTDRAGNTNTMASFDEPRIVVDATPDTLLVAQDQVSFVRAPVQSPLPEPLPGGYEIPAGPSYFALAPADSLDPAEALPAGTFRLSDDGAPTLLRVWADGALENLLRVVRSRPDGTWHRDDLRLPNIDTTQVFVTGVDGAGNESPSVPIETTWFVAASGATVAGRRPHGVSSSPNRASAEVPGDPVVDDRTAAPDADAIVATAGVRWAPRTYDAPLAFASHLISYDAARDRVVMFEGSPVNGTRLYDGTAWTDATPVGTASPSPRQGAAMAYDSWRGRTYLWGADLESELWSWDGARWELVTTSTAPRPRFRHSLAFDSHNGRMILFGGAAIGGPGVLADGSFNDIWALADDEWQLIDPGGPNAPAPRGQHCMAFDSVRGIFVMFGGLRTSTAAASTYYGDTWEWDGASWTQTSTSGPFRRQSCRMTYDAGRERIVLWGGHNQENNQQNIFRDTWEYDGATWTQTATIGPGVIFAPPITYDTKRERVVLHIGVGGETRNETWTYEGTGWHRGVSSAPGAALSTRVAYDAARQQTVAFGGFQPLPFLPLEARTSVWDGAQWRDVPGPGPSPRNGHAMAYDPVREVVVLYGGRDSQTRQRFDDLWEWDGTGWTEITTASTATVPPAYRDHQMAFDPNTQEILMFGGEVDNVPVPIPGRPPLNGQVPDDRTWTWNGSRWLEHFPTNRPQQRMRHRMTTDFGTGTVMVHGGEIGPVCPFECGLPDDTWIWDGVDWTQVATGLLPQGRTDFGLAYDATIERVLLYAGAPGAFSAPSNDLYMWDGAAWIDIRPTSVTPPDRVGPVLFHHDATGQTLIFGGVTFGGIPAPIEDTWQLVAPERPTAQLTVSLPADVPRDAWDQLRARAYCGGRGEGGDGAVLSAWQTRHPAGAFEVLGTTTAGLPMSGGDPSEARIDVTMPDGSRFIAPGDEMHFLCTPEMSSGTRPAEIGLDYVEVRVRYRR